MSAPASNKTSITAGSVLFLAAKCNTVLPSLSWSCRESSFLIPFSIWVGVIFEKFLSSRLLQLDKTRKQKKKIKKK